MDRKEECIRLIVMVALCNRAAHYIFILFLSSSSFTVSFSLMSVVKMLTWFAD